MRNLKPFLLEKRKEEVYKLRIMQTCEFYGKVNTKDHVGIFEKGFYELFFAEEIEETRTAEEIITDLKNKLKGK